MQNVSVRTHSCVDQTQRNSHTHKLACWRPQRGKETGLPSTGRKRMKEEGKERKEREKEKPRVTLASKNRNGDRK